MPDPAGWLPGPLAPVLPPLEVHVWRVALNRPVAEIATLQAVLSVYEAERAQRFHFQQDRRRYTVTRGCLRLLLSRYLHRPANDITLAVTDHGKPYLPDHPLHFNVSHAHECAVIALTRDRPVGVDIEHLQRRLDDEAALVARFFSKSEQAVYFSLPPDQRSLGFFQGWTRKEAYIKARGEGLSHPLHTFAVELRPDEPAAFLTIDDDPQETARWSLRSFSPAPDYIAALATPGPISTCHWFDFRL